MGKGVGGEGDGLAEEEVLHGESPLGGVQGRLVGCVEGGGWWVGTHPVECCFQEVVVDFEGVDCAGEHCRLGCGLSNWSPWVRIANDKNLEGVLFWFSLSVVAFLVFSTYHLENSRELERLGPLVCSDGWHSDSIGKSGACSNFRGIDLGPVRAAKLDGIMMTALYGISCWFLILLVGSVVISLFWPERKLTIETRLTDP